MKVKKMWGLVAIYRKSTKFKISLNSGRRSHDPIVNDFEDLFVKFWTKVKFNKIFSFLLIIHGGSR